jgi:lipopolysaccharide transport system permease protein
MPVGEAVVVNRQATTRETPEVPAAATSPPCPGDREVTLITPARGWQWVDVGELWRYRELVYFLTWRDVKVRYKQTLLGAAWAVLQPAMMMVVFTLFFAGLAGVSSGGLPYPLFAYAGLLPWTFFATAIANAGNSVVGSERLITKIYFPRLAVPLAAVGAAAVDFVVALGLMVLLMMVYGIAPGAGLLLVPVIFGVILLAAVGVGALLAALNVAYRDFKYVIPFLVQVWLFATPSVYMQTPGLASGPRAAAAVAVAAVPIAPVGARPGLPPGRLEALLALNPMTGLVAAFRAAALGTPIDWAGLGLSTAAVLLIFLFGCLYFCKVEDQFADII